jgi:trans-2,3-dihydro-3-hydroxyanthranilate isomerase
LSLTPHEILQVFCAGLGPKFTFVQVSSREKVDASQLDHGKWRTILADTWGTQLFIFAGELCDGAEIYGRMYAPALGIQEDPATGAAAAAIVGAAATASGSREGEFRLNIIQGVAMGRPSVIGAAARLADGTLASIDISGSCVLVAEGQIEVPDHLLERG